MDNSTAHSTTNSSPVSASYVDAYMPPASTPTQSDPDPTPTPMEDPVPYTPPAPASMANANPGASDTVPSSTQSSTPAASASQSEELEDQNIFTMLGVTDGTPEQREKFLDELQQVIWEDFLEYDVKLLTTKEEQLELQKMLAATDTSELEKQERIVVYLEKLIPDLEEIMLEKALELKEEMARERLKGMREFHANNQEALSQVQSAEDLMNEGKWQSAVTVLNSIS